MDIFDAVRELSAAAEKLAASSSGAYTASQLLETAKASFPPPLPTSAATSVITIGAASITSIDADLANKLAENLTQSAGYSTEYGKPTK